MHTCCQCSWTKQPSPLTIQLHHSQLHSAFSFNELGGQEQIAWFQLWEHVYSIAPAMFPQIKGALSMQETATGPCLPVAWRKQAVRSHLARSFNGAESTLYSITVDSFNVIFLGESMVICIICCICVTVLMFTSARRPYRCVREQCSLAPDRRRVLWRAKSLHSWLIPADSRWTSTFKGHIFTGSPGMKQESMPQDLPLALH